MARHNAAELVTGAAVLLVAGGFLAYALAHTGAGGGSGYDLTARFDHIDGINTGADVRVGGVKVGSVVATSLDPKTYQAVVTLTVKDGLQMPTDTSATVTSDGLLGGKYIALQPGGEAANLKPGGTIEVTQGSISLESLLGKFIFSMSNKSSGTDAQKPAAGTPATGTPATGPATPAAPPHASP